MLKDIKIEGNFLVIEKPWKNIYISIPPEIQIAFSFFTEVLEALTDSSGYRFHEPR